jgi:hypothetical protein
MKSLDIFSTQRVRYRGEYSLDAVYEDTFSFLNGKRYDVWETDYTLDGNDKIEVSVEAQKEINALIRRRIDIDIEAYDVNEYKVQGSDDVETVTNGRLIITITGYCDIDYRDIFTGSGWRERLGDVLYTTIRKGWFKKYFGPNYFAPVYIDCAKLRGTLNSDLGRET